MVKFYVFKPAEGIRFGTKWVYADVVQPANYESSGERCPVCGVIVRSRRWVMPRRIKLSSAKPEKYGDFVWGAGLSLLVSHRFLEIYESEGLTGFDEITPPVEIVRIGKLKSGEFPSNLPVYHHVEVPWGGASQDDVASELVHEKPHEIKCSYCRSGFSWRKQRRIVIEEGSWNGTDIFKPRNAPVPFVVSERFKKAAEVYQLRNTWLIPTDNFGYDERSFDLWYVHD